MHLLLYAFCIYSYMLLWHLIVDAFTHSRCYVPNPFCPIQYRVSEHKLIIGHPLAQVNDSPTAPFSYLNPLRARSFALYHRHQIHGDDIRAPKPLTPGQTPVR